MIILHKLNNIYSSMSMYLLRIEKSINQIIRINTILDFSNSQFNLMKSIHVTLIKNGF